jgi:hypothetical protein
MSVTRGFVSITFVVMIIVIIFLVFQVRKDSEDVKDDVERDLDQLKNVSQLYIHSRSHNNVKLSDRCIHSAYDRLNVLLQKYGTTRNMEKKLHMEEGSIKRLKSKVANQFEESDDVIENYIVYVNKHYNGEEVEEESDGEEVEKDMYEDI